MELHRRAAGPAAAGPRDARHDATSRGPILFIHGYPLDGSLWDRQLEAFRAELDGAQEGALEGESPDAPTETSGTPATPGVLDGWRAVAPDLRGFGRSPLGDGLPTGRAAGHDVARADEPVLTMERHADDLAALLEAEGGAPAVVCGLSMGGYVAFALLRRHPGLVRALVLADTRAGADDDAGRENRRRSAATAREKGAEPIARAMLPSLLAESTLRERPEVVAHARRMVEETPPATLVAALAGMAARPDSTGDLAGIRVPTLVVVGEHDAITPPDVARAMADAIPGARLVTIPGAGHLAPLENPGAFNAALAEFVGGL